MEGKKISFGFMKTKKPEKIIVEEKRDYIECVEEKSIKIVGGEKAEEAVTLVIPMKPNTLITAEKLREIAEKVESSLNEPEKEPLLEVKPQPVENETLEQMAVRELMQEATKEVTMETQTLTVPVPSKPVMEGQKESTLDDYEAIPIQEFGLAMLRGMGWAPGSEKSKFKQPELRPKGLGLGADKVISDNKQKNASKDNKEEELAIIKNSYVKITTGKHSGYYGKVVSLDEDNGRVMVDITVKKETVSLSEFMMQPVTKAEFDKESKVINSDAYQEYKKNERSDNQKSSKHESPQIREREASSSISSDSRDRRDKEDHRRRDYDKSSNGRSRDKVRSRKDSSSSDDRGRRRKDKHRDDSSDSDDRSRRRHDKYRRDSSEDRSRKRKDKKKYESNDSLDSISDTEKKKKPKNSRKYKDSESESDTHKKDRRDIDKKRKGKKKKRDRDRSPNYKKHRK